MSSFEAQRKSARNLVLSPNAQAAYGTALADAKFTRRQRFDGSAALDLNPTRRSDKDYAGKGTVFATDGQTTGWDAKFSFKAEADAWLLAWALSMLMGKETVTGATSPFTHTPSFDESTATAVATSLYVEDTEDVKYKLIDATVNEVTITIPEQGAVQLETSLIATGRMVSGAMATIPAVSDYAYLLGSDCAATFGVPGALADIGARLLSATIKLGNGAAVHKALGGGLYGYFNRTGVPSISLQATIAAKETDDIFTHLLNDDLLGMTLSINSGATAKANIAIPSAKFKTAKLGVQDNFVIWSIEADDTTMFASGSTPMTFGIVNAEAKFLEAA